MWDSHPPSPRAGGARGKRAASEYVQSPGAFPDDPEQSASQSRHEESPEQASQRRAEILPAGVDRLAIAGHEIADEAPVVPAARSPAPPEGIGFREKSGEEAQHGLCMSEI